MTYVIWLCAPRGWMAPLALAAKPGKFNRIDSSPRAPACTGMRSIVDRLSSVRVPVASTSINIARSLTPTSIASSRVASPSRIDSSTGTLDRSESVSTWAAKPSLSTCSS